MCLGIHLIPVRDVLIIQLRQSKLFNFKNKPEKNNRQCEGPNNKLKNVLDSSSKCTSFRLYFRLMASNVRALNFQSGRLNSIALSIVT